MFDIFDIFPRCRVAVIGDLMLDSYLYGDVCRISPEAPVPVVRALSEKQVAGGAANVAVNLATLGLTVELVGLTGQDEANEQLKACLRAAGEVNCRGMLASGAPPHHTQNCASSARISRWCESITRTWRLSRWAKPSCSPPRRRAPSRRPTSWCSPTTARACSPTPSCAIASTPRARRASG